MRMRAMISLVLGLLIFGAAASTQQQFSFRAIASGLNGPWEVTWGPDSRLWVTERTGKRVVRINPTSGAVAPAVTIDEVYPGESWHDRLADDRVQTRAVGRASSDRLSGAL